MNGDLTTWLKCTNEPKLGGLEREPRASALGYVAVACQAGDKNSIDSNNNDGALTLEWQNGPLFSHVTTTLPLRLGYATQSLAAG